MIDQLDDVVGISLLISVCIFFSSVTLSIRSKNLKLIKKESTRTSRKELEPVMLQIHQSADISETTHLLNEDLLIGRASESHIRITDSYTSNIHARIYKEKNLTFVEDLHSTNGTFVNKNRITRPQVLKCGDTIQIGEITMEIK